MEAPVHQKLDDLWSAADRFYMLQALALAAQAREKGEIPVGAVVVAGGEVVGEGFNQPICDLRTQPRMPKSWLCGRLRFEPKTTGCPARLFMSRWSPARCVLGRW